MTFKLKILGSNAAAPAHNRNQTSQILQVRNHYFLIDCGEGTQILLKRYRFKLSRINHIFISHLHGDHYYGLIGLISTMHLYGRDETLSIYGPPGLGEIISVHLKHSNTLLNFDIDLKEWTPGSSELIYENKNLTVTTFPMDHRIACSGFLFREKALARKIIKGRLPDGMLPSQIAKLKKGENVDGSNGQQYKWQELTEEPRKPFTYAYCSDTKYSEAIIPMVKGADMMYHEATFLEDMSDRAILTYHTTAQQAAELAKKAKVGKLILGHFSTRYRDLEPIQEEARKTFKESYLGIEGEDFVLIH